MWLFRRKEADEMPLARIAFNALLAGKALFAAE
jgi:hypothetical protein